MSRPCHNYTDTNDRDQVPCSSSSSLTLSMCTVEEPAMVPGGEVGCFPKHPLHFPEDHHPQCNSYTAFTSLPMLFDWFSLLLPLFCVCTKFSIRHLFLYLGNTFSPDFQQGPCKNKQRRWHTKTGFFLTSTALINCKKNKGRNRISYCSTTIGQ